MAKRDGGESLAVTVYEQLRTAILNGRLSPGQRLKPTEIGSEYQVSLGVTREALGLLAAQNLVRIDRNRGFHVTPLSLDALTDLTEARVINEGAALRKSVERGGVTWESEVLAAHHRMASQPMVLAGTASTRNEEWANAHIGFHYKLIEACGNPVLLDICVRLSDAAELYRAWSGVIVGEMKRDVAAEHKELLDAALAHDADRAVAVFEAHIERTRDILAALDLPSTEDIPAKPLTTGT